MFRLQLRSISLAGQWSSRGLRGTPVPAPGARLSAIRLVATAHALGSGLVLTGSPQRTPGIYPSHAGLSTRLTALDHDPSADLARRLDLGENSRPWIFSGSWGAGPWPPAGLPRARGAAASPHSLARVNSLVPQVYAAPPAEYPADSFARPIYLTWSGLEDSSHAGMSPWS